MTVEKLDINKFKSVTEMKLYLLNVLIGRYEFLRDVYRKLSVLDEDVFELIESNKKTMLDKVDNDMKEIFNFIMEVLGND